MDISLRIKQLRKKKKLSQTDFAKKINTNRGIIAQIELGNSKPSIELLEIITKKFNTSYDWLIDGTGEMLQEGSNIQCSNSKVKGDNNIVGGYFNTVISCKELELENNYLKKELEMLKKQILMQDKMITMLENNNK